MQVLDMFVLSWCVRMRAYLRARACPVRPTRAGSDPVAGSSPTGCVASLPAHGGTGGDHSASHPPRCRRADVAAGALQVGGTGASLCEEQVRKQSASVMVTN